MKSIITLRRSILGAVLLGSALALNATAHPAGLAVHYQDVDLSSQQGAAVLYARISKAAERVCAQSSRNDLRQVRLFELCYQGAVANAVNSVNANTLTALHRVKTQKAALAG